MAFQARLLTSLADPTLSLCEVAERLGLPLDQLSLVIARPDLAAEIAALDVLAATRIRLVATSCLPAAASTARRILDDFNSRESDCSPDAALRAARILLRLANFASGPIQPRSAPIRSFPRATPSRAPASAPSSASSDSSADKINPESSRSNPRLREQPKTSVNADDTPAEPECERDLSESESITFAAELIRQGAFTPDELGAVFRTAAAGLDFEALQSDLTTQLSSHPPSDDACIAEFLALADKFQKPSDRPDIHHATHEHARALADQLACVPP